MALILCIETGTSVCSAALARDGKVIAVAESLEGREHGSKLGVFVDDLLRGQGVAAEDLDAVAVGRGPGSYTGLRIGVSLAKGICYGASVPLISVDSLAAMTVLARELACDADALYCPMIDARRMEVYARVFDAQLKPLTDVEALVIDSESLAEYRTRKFIIFGDGADKCAPLLPWATKIDITSSARGMAMLAQQAFDEGRTEDTAYFEPFYLKDFVVTTSKKKIF